MLISSVINVSFDIQSNTIWQGALEIPWDNDRRRAQNVTYQNEWLHSFELVNQNNRIYN